MAPRHLDGPGSPSQPMWPWWRTNQSNPPCNSRSQWQSHFISFPMLRGKVEKVETGQIYFGPSSDNICYWDRIKMQVDSSLSGSNSCSRLNCPDRLEENLTNMPRSCMGIFQLLSTKKKKNWWEAFTSTWLEEHPFLPIPLPHFNVAFVQPFNTNDLIPP